ncbi:MAG: hypothetical protein SGJ02_01705, partial [bacterium]|nr:hypothetical protein [bacterium]
MKDLGGNIGVIGPRSSGKTTYLAALAYWPERKLERKQKSAFEIESSDELEANAKIIEKAKERILEGSSFEPTTVAGGIDDLDSYMFTIKVKRFLRPPDPINLVAVDYPGEIFNELVNGESNSLHEEFIEKCLRKDVKGLLILLPGWERGSDSFYEQMIRKFLGLMDSYGRMNDLRLAVAMSKCERGEIWSGRLDPEIDLFNMHLRETTAVLRKKLPRKNLEFFAISTFGVLSRNNPRPNRVDEIGQEGVNSVLREPNEWRPYGMIAPLYWLSTG